MTIDLEEFAVALDAYPLLQAYDRAIVFSAVDLAPHDFEKERWSESETEHYFDSPSYAAWKHANKVALSLTTSSQWAVTLEEAAGYVTIATKEDILAGLYRGVRLTL